MCQYKNDLLLHSTKVMNVIFMTIPFMGCWFVYYATRIRSPFFNKGNWVVVLLFLVLYVILGHVYESFLISFSRILEMIYGQALAVGIADAIMYIVICLLSKRIANFLPLIFTFVVQVIFAAVWSCLAKKWYFAVSVAKKTMIVYDCRKGIEDLINEYGLNKKFNVKRVVGVDECLSDLTMLQTMEVVFLSGIHSHDRNIILKYCIEEGILVYVIPRVGDVIMSSAQRRHMFHLPILQVRRYSPSPYYLFIKRLVDVFFSIVAITLLSPIYVATAIAIKLYDGGEIFYKQCRLTKNGKKFDVIKFRSMRMDAEKDGVARLSSGDQDDRITPIGRFIRKTRIDELPQFFNILRGDMSICGPRPERPEIVTEYEEKMPEFHLRLQAKAGLTGYAQVYGKYNTTPYDKLMMDLMYIARPSIIEDLRIMFATVKILFMKESTEGVVQGAVTAMDIEK